MEKSANIIIVNLPKSSGTYKIIQLHFSGRNCLYHDYPAQQDRYLLFGNKGDFHNDILRRFLQSTGMQTDETPAPAGKDYKAIGMGRADIDLDRKSILFYGHSSIYQIPINREFLEHLKKQMTDWRIDIVYN